MLIQIESESIGPLCRVDSNWEWVHWTSLLYKDVVEPPFHLNQFLLSCFFEVNVVLQNSLPCWFRLKMSPLHIFALQGCGWVTHPLQLVYVILLILMSSFKTLCHVDSSVKVSTCKCRGFLSKKVDENMIISWDPCIINFLIFLVLFIACDKHNWKYVNKTSPLESFSQTLCNKLEDKIHWENKICGKERLILHIMYCLISKVDKNQRRRSRGVTDACP